MFGRKKNRTIGEITYAIDHDTGLLENGVRFKTVVMEDGKLYESVYVLFNRKKFKAEFSVAGSLEQVTLVLLSNNNFDLNYSIDDGDGNRAVINSTFSDMRKATFEVYSKSKQSKSGASRLTSVIAQNGGNPELLSSCVTAFRSYLRNKNGGKLEPKVKEVKVKVAKKPGRVPSATPTKTQGSNLKTYQLERREAVKELRDVMCSAKESLGVSIQSRGVPTISTVAVQEYLSTGLMEMSLSKDRVRVAKKIIKKYHFETQMQAKAFYPAAVEAVRSATEAIDEFMKS